MNTSERSKSVSSVFDICATGLKNLGVDMFNGNNSSDVISTVETCCKSIMKGIGCSTKRDNSLLATRLDSSYYENFNDIKSYHELVLDLGLSLSTIKKLEITFKEGLIPIIDGKGGTGKSYTAEQLTLIVHKIWSEIYPSKQYKGIYQMKLGCTRFSKTEFSKGFDAVSNYVQGVFSQCWKDAEADEDNLYYLILDEVYNLMDIREVFGEYFAVLAVETRPKNLVIIATGNPDITETTTSIVNSITHDSGIARRFKRIWIDNILVNSSSEEYIRFFNDLLKDSSLDSRLIALVKTLDSSSHFKNMMLVPSRVINFCKASKLVSNSYEDYLDYLSCNTSSIEELFVDKQSCVKEINSSIVSLLCTLEED